MATAPYPFPFGFSPAYAPTPVPAYAPVPAAATHSFSSPYYSAPAPFTYSSDPAPASSVSPPPACNSLRFSPPPPAGRLATAPLRRQVPTKPSTTLPSVPTSKVTRGGAPADHTLMELQPYEVRPTVENSRALYKGGKSDEQSGIFHHATPDFMCQGSKTEENGNSTAALSRPPLDCLHANVFDNTTEVTTTASASVGSGYYASSTSTGPTPFLGFIASSGSKATASTTVSASATSASTVPSATAYATQVFGEIPTPKSCPRTHASALHYYQEHVTPVQSTFVPDRNCNLTEQHLDAMSQQYGFHNLNRRSVFLADGSKHSYFALPETYPLERAVPEPVFDAYDDETKGCTDEFVDEFASTPEQQLYEDPQVNVLVIHERRKEWDPGEHAIRSSTRNTDIAAETYPLARASPNSESDGCSNDFVHVYTGTHEQQAYEEEQCESRKAPECFSKLTVAIDDIFSFTNERKSDAAILAVCYNNASDHAFSEEATDLTYPAAPALHADRYIKLANKESTQVVSIPCVQEATMHCDVNRFEIKINKQDVLIHKHGITYHSDLNTDMEVPFALQYQLPLSSAPGIWDPSIAISHLLIFIGQPVDLKQFWSQLLLQRHCWYTTPNALLQKQYFYLPVVLDCLYSETVKQLFCYSSMFHSAEAIHSVMSMSTATTVRLLLVLSSWKIAQEGRDAAAVYHVGTIQLPMRKTSHNPGTMLFLYKSKWRLRYMEEKINWHKDIKFYQVTLWLIHFLPP